MEFLIKYFEHFANSPDHLEGLLMWTFCTGFVWIQMIMHKREAIDGMKGSNLFWEGYEQAIYWVLMMVPPIVFKAAFVSDVPANVWWFMGGVIGFAFFGRSILDYGLAFLGRAPVKEIKQEEIKPQ